MVWYVNNEGPITSANSCPQTGKCERMLPDNDPELVAFFKKAEDARNGVTSIDERVKCQMESPLVQVLLGLAPEYEGKIRDGLYNYYKALK